MKTKTRKRKVTLKDVVTAAHEAGVRVDVRLEPKPTSEPQETSEQKDERIIQQAMQRRKRLSVEDANHLAAGFMVKRSIGKMRKQHLENIKSDIEDLRLELEKHSSLANGLMRAARRSENSAACGASQIVWERAADLLHALYMKHFHEPDGQNTQQMMAMAS